MPLSRGGAWERVFMFTYQALKIAQSEASTVTSCSELRQRFFFYLSGSGECPIESVHMSTLQGFERALQSMPVARKTCVTSTKPNSTTLICTSLSKRNDLYLI